MLLFKTRSFERPDPLSLCHLRKARTVFSGVDVVSAEISLLIVVDAFLSSVCAQYEKVNTITINYNDDDNNIFKQYNLYEIRDQYNALLYEVKENRDSNIDFSKSFTNITK